MAHISFSSPHLKIRFFSEMGRDIPARDVSHYVHCYLNKLTSDVIARERVKLCHWSFGILRETDGGDFDGDF